jgi:hypothetical protein
MVSSVCSNALTDRQGRARGDPVFFLRGLYRAPPHPKPSRTRTSTSSSSSSRTIRLPQTEGPFRSKTVPILLGWNAKTLHEGTAKTVGIVKPNGIGDTFYRTAGGREAGPRFVKAKPLYKGSWTAFEFCLEPARKLPRAKIHPLGQGID